jgi:hypothetical protein
LSAPHLFYWRRRPHAPSSQTPTPSPQSFVPLPTLAPDAVAAALARKVPALSDAAFAEKQALLRARLGGLKDLAPLDI